MKNVQVIDGADNCTYSIYQFTDEEFSVVFPGPGQDIEFAEDAIARVENSELGRVLSPVWKRLIKKTDVVGIHGTLFYELLKKKKYYPSKRDKEMITGF